ncbi:hypothetical protein B6463_03865 [Campylobacter jejuni]|nr:hypothetical protein [Campylobacter jejuni]
MKKILLILGLLVVGANAESKIYINKFTADKVGKCVLKEDKTYLVEIFRSHLEISELNASVVLLSRFSDDLKSVRKLCNSKKMFISYNNYYKSS